jgi:cytochrome c2
MRFRAALALLVAAPLLLAQLSGTGGKPRARPTWDPETNAYVRKGCVGCHKFTGTREAVGVLGPDLTKVKTRLTKDQVREILDDPSRFHPGTSMPALDLSRRDKELIVRFLWGENKIVAKKKPQAKPTVLVFHGYRNTPSNYGKKRKKRRR